MKAAYADWYGHVADPRFHDVPVDMLLSDERAVEWYAKIKAGEQFEACRATRKRRRRRTLPSSMTPVTRSR